MVTCIDDHSRFIVIATVVAVRSGRAVCAAFTAAMRRYGPFEVLSDNGKQFTGRFTRPQPVEVLFERTCRQNGITRVWPALGPSGGQLKVPFLARRTDGSGPRAVTVAVRSSHCTARGALLKSAKERMEIIAAYREAAGRGEGPLSGPSQRPVRS
jgi:hypothetical protein